MPCREATRSPNKNNDGSWDRTFVVHGVTDAEQALGVAAAAAETTFLGCSRDDEPEMRPIGFSIWEVIYHYAAPESPSGPGTEDPGDNPTGDENDLEAVIEFDTTGGTAHITQCLEQTEYGPEDATELKNSKCIGASGDSVEGTDIVVPKLVIKLNRRPPPVTGNYIKSLADLTGKTNVAPYRIRGRVLGIYCEIDFEGGELMFLGASPTGESLNGHRGKKIDGKFTFSFEASANRVNINIGEGAAGAAITVATKKGHEYMWMHFAKKELATPKVAIPVPLVAFVSKLQESVSFLDRLGF